MRLMKKIATIVIAMSICLTSSLNIMAASGYKSQWQRFTTISQGTSETNYTKTVQRLVRDYNSITRRYIDNNGGVDGDFGASTKLAVEEFQEGEGCSSWDGVVGPETWGKFSDNITKGTTIYIDNEGYFDAYRTSGNMSWTNYEIRRGTASGKWMVKTTNNGFSDPGIGTYVTFNWP